MLVSRTGIRLIACGIACGAVLLFVPLLSSRESVRSELARLQDRRGYRLVAVRDNKLFTVSFADRTIKRSRPLVGKGTLTNGTVSPDGTKVASSLCLDPGITHPTTNASECPGGFVLAIVRTDGSELQVYRDFANPGLGICWSHDMSKLALTMDDRRQDRYASFELQILYLKTGETEVIGDGSEAFVDSQCWSSDDKQVVYTINKPVGVQIVRVYDAQAKTSKDLASGGHATWSPDGNWIAFLNCPPSLRGCKYYGMRTSTNEQKLFFKTDGQTGLSWSPDCRFVAYVNVASPFERTPPEQLREMLRLRVRRLEDNAEYSVADFFDGDIMWFDWTS
jgi:dipeptidyl aminopeptidase/acylaminoacyl peptidase